jgi:hypothetical protein
MKPLRFSLVLTLLLILFSSSLMVVLSASASTALAVPEFTANYVDASYDVPTTHSVDPYTGADVTHQGYHVQNRTIQVSIENVPFTAYESDGQIINYYLNIRVKGSYDNDWLTVYSPDNEYVKQSNSSTTIVVFSLDDDCFPFWDNIPGGGTADFQVQALVGSVHRIQNASAPSILTMYPWVFDGQTGDWSSTQTVTIPSGATTAQPTPTAAAIDNPASSSIPAAASEGNMRVNDLVIIVAVASAAIIAAVIAVAAVLIKRAKTQTATAPPN